nr:hypothetical protein CFP56_58712 [Quercus suber]
MQSSPPTQAWQRPVSPAESKYSLDLGALDGEDDSGQLSPLPHPKFERVNSEDIEGPSDFTLNLEKWMKGGTFGRGTIGNARQTLESLQERAGEPGQDAVPRNEHDSGEKVHEDQITDDRHTPKNTPPRTASSWSVPKPANEQIAANTRHEELASSDWKPYSHESTPQLPLQAQAHQPTVEDYDSEMTPARQRSVSRHLSSSARDTSPTIVRRPSSIVSEPSTVGQIPGLNESSSATQPPKERSSFQSNVRIESQLQLMQERCIHLQDLSVALNLALEEERKSRKQAEALCEDRMAKALQREQDLMRAEKSGAEALSQADWWRTKSEEQEKELSVLRKSVRSQEEEAENQHLQEKHASEMWELRKQLKQQQDEHAEQLRKLQQQDFDRPTETGDQLVKIQQLRDELEATREQYSAKMRHPQADKDVLYRNHEAIETSAKNPRNELSDPDDPGEADLDRMQLELKRAHDMSGEIDELREQLRIVVGEKQQISVESAAVQERVAGLEADLKRMSLTKNTDLARATGELQRSKKLLETLEQQTKDLRQQLHDQRVTYEAEAELKRLGEPDIDPEMMHLRDDVTAKQTALDAALRERDALQIDHRSARTELGDLKSTIANLHAELADSRSALDDAKSTLEEAEAVNAAFDAKISNAICRRETYWRERLEKMAEERKLMVKQLMHLWGQEDVGKVRPQEFEYRFVKSGKDKGGRLATS